MSNEITYNFYIQRLYVGYGTGMNCTVFSVTGGV